MYTRNFKAGVQYDDYTGTLAADSADLINIKQELIKVGLINENEFVIGLDFYPLGQYSGQDKEISVDYYILDSFNFEEFRDQIRNGIKPTVRKVNQDLTFREFFDLFKRFNGTLSWKGLIDQIDIDVNE
ncbi:hypothetical protein SJ000_01250 [Acinetobacter baumannii]|uniref:hypothetical protein n=1 Tax=Acinetobacter baumannii TaxID=470 RepID=UPI0029DDB8E2|nr:hypothetical protein [Acinetobacter baumannii]MDX7942309.1 hypothetical protein [Acinetobacter baumannii]